MNIRILTIAAILAICVPVFAQEDTDTVKVIENACRVMVTQSVDTTAVEVVYRNDDTNSKNIYSYELNIQDKDQNLLMDFPKDWGMSLPFFSIEPKQAKNEKKRTKRYFVFFNHAYWGWRFNYGGDRYINDCFELGFRNVIGMAWKRGGSEFEIGLGFNMARFLSKKGMVFFKESDKLISCQAEEGVDVRHSRIDVGGFQVPLIYNQKIAGPLQTTIGAILNFNTYAKAYNELGKGDVTINSEYKGLHQNLFSVEAYAAIHISDFGIYATWKPMKLFDENYGPEIKSWSLGVELLF